MTAVCAKCGETKDVADFYRSSRSLSGHYSYCKACSSAANKARYRENRAAVLERQRAYRLDPDVAARDRANKADYYLRNRDAIRERARIWKVYNYERAIARRQREYAENRDALRQLKAHPCADCGVQYPAAAMHFDHVRGTKLYNIGNGSMRRGDLAAELAKCELRCANCHAVRHDAVRQMRLPS